MCKVYPNETDSLDRFTYMRLYVDKELSMDSVEEAYSLVGWGCKVNLMDIQ